VSSLNSARRRWHPRAPAWGAAIVAGLGCALPLLLGLVSGHPGFLWAALGAFQAARANPLHRFGMPRMLLLISLGACSSGLGLWVAADASASLLLFAACGLLLAWLQRFGVEAGKLGLGIAICLCLGQSYQATSELPTPAAVAALFCVGGLWVALLAFGLRGAHGLRMWPYMPRLRNLLKVLRRHAARLPQREWRLHALGCTLAFGLAGAAVVLLELEHGYWLTLTVLGSLHLKARASRSKAVQACSSSLAVAALLALLGHSLQNPAIMVALVLPLIMLSRAIQANSYRLFMLQSISLCLLLAESLAADWTQLEPRLLGGLYGFALALAIGLLVRLAAEYRLDPAHPLKAPRKRKD